MLTKIGTVISVGTLAIAALIVGVGVGDEGIAPELPGTSEEDKKDRRTLLLTVTREELKRASGVTVDISYKSTSSSWRETKHKKFTPWTHKVSVKRGDFVHLRAHQVAYNGLSCVIENLDTGERSRIGTRRSSGEVKCNLYVK